MTDTLASRADGTAGTSAFTYDWANRELTATSPIATGTTSTTYRLDGLIATRTAGNAETATLTYDPVKRPINVAFATGGSLWQSYDRLGNVATEGRTLTGISGNAGTGTQAFTYDALRRVTKATIPGTNTTCGLTGVACYGYDRDGNRTTKQVAATTTTYTYHPTDEIKDQTISGVTKTFLYNLYGSQTTAFDAANAVTTSAYDTAERKLTVTPPAGGVATYTYDALGRITTKTIGTSVDTYSYLGSSKTAWQIANAGGTGFTTKSALDATGARTAVNGNALTGYLGFDLHGNTVLAENASKVITDALRYDAWGELIASTTSALPTPWRYQGRLDVGPDASNPLYDFGARDYRPVTGAFTSLDSYAGQAIDPLSMNRFLYAEANPATFVDPDGHSVDSGIGNCQPSCPADVQAAAAAKQAAANAAKASKAADDRESAHIVMRAGGAGTPAGPPPTASTTCHGNRGCLGALQSGSGNGVAQSFVAGVGVGALVTGFLLATCALATAGICLAAGFGVGLVGAIGIQSDINIHGEGIEGTPAHIGGHEPWSGEEIAFLAGSLLGSYGAESAMGPALRPLVSQEEVPLFARTEYEAVSKSDWAATLARDPLCVYCGAAKSTSVDHVTALKQDWLNGGFLLTRAERSALVNDPSNLVGACMSCNSAKGARPLGIGPRQWWPPNWGADPFPFGGSPR